jgi:hypothetical protein
MADLDLPSLPPAARVAHLFPALKGQSLLSVGQLCDAGCDAHFTATTVTIDHQGTTVLTGHESSLRGKPVTPTKTVVFTR